MNQYEKIINNLIKCLEPEKGVLDVGLVIRLLNKLDSTIPQGRDAIQHSVFDGCKTVRKIIMPNDTKGIEDGMFLEYNNLTDVEWETGKNKLSKDIIEKKFKGCENLKRIKYNGITYNVSDLNINLKREENQKKDTLDNLLNNAYVQSKNEKKLNNNIDRNKDKTNKNNGQTR